MVLVYIFILGLLTLTEGLSMGLKYCHRCSLIVTGYLISMSINGDNNELCPLITRVMVVTDIWVL